MGQRIVLTCDYALGKKPCDDTAGVRPVELGSDEILKGDFCAKHREKVIQWAIKFGFQDEKSVQPRIGGGFVTATGVRFSNADVRQWMMEQKREVSRTGRLPIAVIKEYAESH